MSRSYKKRAIIKDHHNGYRRLSHKMFRAKERNALYNIVNYGEDDRHTVFPIKWWEIIDPWVYEDWTFEYTLDDCRKRDDSGERCYYSEMSWVEFYNKLLRK